MKITQFKVFVFSLGLAGGLVLGRAGDVNAQSAETEKPANSAQTYQLLNLFGDVFERVRSQYVEKPTDEELLEAAIQGMLQALDPHSGYLNIENFREMRVNTRGEFGGLGIQVTLENGLIRVISPIDDTPAFNAGIKSGDLITHLDGEQIQGLTLQEAVERMRGKVGSKIKLTIVRQGRNEPFDVDITRDIIKITSVRHRVEGNAGYVRITSFNEQTDVGLEKAMKKIKAELGEKLQGYVLDLRNNPGGLLDQAVAVSDAFLEKGEIVSTRSRDPEDTSRHNAKPGDLAEGKPVVILINGGSASASEIVAGALQDHRRAIVLGTKSFGKGSVQTIIPLQGRRAMRLTTARYYTPSGRSIQAKGIDPDIEVAQARVEEIAQRRSRRESDLRGALDAQDRPQGDAPAADEGNSDDQPAAPSAEDETPAEPQDYQLSRALDLLAGLSLFSGEATTN